MSRDMTLLHPELQVKFAELKALCAAQGMIIKNTSTYRDADEQAACVAEGTSSLHYPNSLHNWYVAVDFCRNDGTGPYNNADGFFTRVGRLAESIGLIWGGSFTRPDKPHLQLAHWGKTADVLKDRYGDPETFRASWNKEPVVEDLQPAVGLAIGDEVIVKGTIYGRGNGTGGEIHKDGATMYIVDYAGANYPHCYGVAKKPDGTRQGWAAPEILFKAGQEDQENAETGYQRWHAICNEPYTNVRNSPGVPVGDPDGNIQTAWPLLGVGNEVEVIGEGMAPNGRLWYKILIAGKHTGWVYGGFLDRR